MTHLPHAPSSSVPVASPAQARQTRLQFATADDHLSYELGKAVQALPPLYLRLLAGSLTAVVVSTIAWAALSKIDEVAIAPGELAVNQQVRPVQALSAGTIRRVLVQEGDRVQQGDLLIEQDATVSQAGIERLAETATLIRGDIARLEAERNGTDVVDNALQSQLLAARQQEFSTRQTAALTEVERQGAAIAEAQARLTRLQENLASARLALDTAEQREQGLRSLADPATGAIPRFDYLEARDRLNQAQDQVASLEQDIAAQQQAIRQVESAYAIAQEAANRLSSERQAEILTQLNQRREELTNIDGQLAQATTQQNQDSLRAPIDGVVYNLQVSAAEGTLQPGKELLTILPDDGGLILEAKVRNRDIGFVAPGMRAKVKLAAFPFQEFGTLEGEVMQISPSAIADRDLGPVYIARVRLAQSNVVVYGQEVALLPGMIGTAELVTRQRSILTFLLEPVSRRFNEAFQTR